MNKVISNGQNQMLFSTATHNLACQSCSS